MSSPEVAQIMTELASMKKANVDTHAKMFNEMQEMKEKQDESNLKTDEMYKIFLQGSGFITVLKIIGIMAGAITAIILLVKNIK